jgi:hypothetical protein
VKGKEEERRERVREVGRERERERERERAEPRITFENCIAVKKRDSSAILFEG